MAKKSFHNLIRMLLSDSPDGMTVAELADEIGSSNASMWRSVRSMPDAYICGWVRQANGAGPFRAKWKVVQTPRDAARPDSVDSRMAG